MAARATAERELVLDVLRRVGGRVALEELLYKTGLTRARVLAALAALERRGLAEPISWQATAAAAPTARTRP